MTQKPIGQNRTNASDSFRSLLGMVGLTGVEPVTLRLSSACSNQLSYRPGYDREFEARPFRILNGGAEEIRTPDL